MTINEIKKKLHSYRYIEFKIKDCNENLYNLANLIDTQRGVKTQILTSMPHISSNVSDPVGEAAEKIIDRYRHEYAHYEYELKILYEEKHIIDNMINKLDVIERQIIELKYFKKYKWWMVAQTMNYSERQCRRIEMVAIKKLLEVKNE